MLPCPWWFALYRDFRCQIRCQLFFDRINPRYVWGICCFALTWLAVSWGQLSSLTIDDLKKSHERRSPLRADTGGSREVFGTGYWDD